MIFALADYYGDTTNSIAKAKALLQGLELCREKGEYGVDIEVDYDACAGAREED